jgi:hypothetical protein
MFELIPSRDTREYLEKIGHTFNDFEKATLIYNNIVASIPEKEKALIETKERTTDERLIQQINERLEYNESLLDDAHTKGYDMPTSKVCFDNRCQATDMWSYEGENNLERASNPERFEWAYISIPHPFRQEDIVRIVGTNIIGIVCGCESDAAVHEYDVLMKKETLSRVVDGKEIAISDYCDCQITVDAYYDGDRYLSSIYHEHVNPVNLEYANLSDEDKRKGFLEYINNTLFHNSMFGGIGRSSKRIPAVLEQLQKLWEKHPDLRLGQLLLNILEQTPLFAIEDEMLMDKIQALLDIKNQ